MIAMTTKTPPVPAAKITRFAIRSKKPPAPSVRRRVKAKRRAYDYDL
jgi:hypothetical protein